ncbi:MAG: PQQ-binding-like beta-propeller repeat protein, partial [Betaproteobacteria bacterium]
STAEVKAFSLATGELTWVMDSLKYRGLTGPKVLPGFVFVGDFEGNVFALDETDGRIVGSFDGGGRVTKIDLNAFGTIFVQTSTGNFSAHSLSSGN